MVTFQFIQRYHTQTDKLQAISYKTMYKVLPCVIEQLCKEQALYFSKSFA